MSEEKLKRKTGDKPARIRRAKVKSEEKKSDKKIIIWAVASVLLLVVVFVLLTNWKKIFHRHTWVEATCEAASYCESCGKTEGEPLGHSFNAATCELPSTCERCGLTEGEALGHVYEEAPCGEKMRCSRCGGYSDEPNPHTTDMGICEKCGVFQNEQKLFELAVCWNKVVNTVNGVGLKDPLSENPDEEPEETVSEDGKPADLKTEEEMAVPESEAVAKVTEEAEKMHRDEVYNDMCTRIYNYQLAIEALEELKTICGDNESLQNIKNKADEFISAIPSSYVLKDSEAMIEFLGKESELIQIQKDINDEIMGMLSVYVSSNNE